MARTVVWFSCGAASAVAARMTCEHDWQETTGERTVYIEWQRRQVAGWYVRCAKCGRAAFKHSTAHKHKRFKPGAHSILLIPRAEDMETA